MMTSAAGSISIDPHSGVPFYRQIIDQILLGIAAGHFQPRARLPTVRQLATDLKVNTNTVSRAYRELEIRGMVVTHRGTGTFIAAESRVAKDEAKRLEFVEKFCDQVVADAGKLGFSLQEVLEALHDRLVDRR